MTGEKSRKVRSLAKRTAEMFGGTAQKPVIGITMGDPGGIGPEIIIKTLRRLKPPRQVRLLVIGDWEVFELLKRKTKLGIPFRRVDSPDAPSWREGRVHFLDVSQETAKLLQRYSPAEDPASFKIGEVSRVNAAMTLAALAKATELAVQGRIRAIATAPLNKEALRLLEPSFRGHTEYLAHASGCREFAMMFVSPKLKVTLVTLHIPLKRVSEVLTSELIESKIRLTDHFLKTHFKIPRPKIAVCALNPHGKETGEEEEKVIIPAIAALRKLRVDVRGPFPSDILFYYAYRGQYDAVVSMYHDQGLGPFKMQALHEGVNVTVGLPFVRTSPDHGTAFDIAWQRKADPSSMTASLRLACRFLKKADTRR
jgi:4-hydroxythreonine-4-phosphate dehydrogenase